MNRFNLTFSGEILAGYDPAEVKLRFSKMFAIDDPVRLERFFSGQTVILRRNLERKAAAQCYHELQLLGLVAALIKVTASEATESNLKAPPQRVNKISNTSRPDKTDIAAQIKLRKAESQRLAEEKTARAQSAREEQQRNAAHDIARQHAAAEEIRRIAAAEAAHQAEERLQAKRRDAAAADRKLAIKAEARRQAAAAAAQQQMLREQQKAERARLKAEETARRKAALEETKRRKAEEVARAHAALEAKKRREAEEAARLRAELELIKRQEAAEVARLQTELELIKRQEAADAARIKAEAQRKEAEAQRQSAERRRAAAEQLAAQRTLRKEEKRKAALELAERAAFSEALHEQAAQRAAEELAGSRALKSSKAPIVTNLEVPQRRAAQTAEVATPAPRKRQLGEPNLYKLTPFRNTDEVRARSAQAHQRMRQGYTLGAVALAALLIAGGSFLGRAGNGVITGATAIVIDPQSAPLLLADDRLLFHDRAGVSTKEVPLTALGLSTLTPPMFFDSSGALLALGRLSGDSAKDAAVPNTLLRCNLTSSTCEHFSPMLEGRTISAFAIHPMDGSVLLADSAAGDLLKVNQAGKIVARAAIALPALPVLRLHGGLLLMNSADGPAISVLRYEDNAFGQQLDEILLLPPAAQQAQQSRVDDFLWASGTWWASLLYPATGSVGLYRFDEKWNYIDEVALPGTGGPLQLVSWGEKTLVNDTHRTSVQRFNAHGATETPFLSTQLADLVAGEQRSATVATIAWRAGLLLCALATVLGCGFGYLQNLRRLVYKPHRARGAEPIDDYANTLHWIDPVQNRLALLRSRSFSYGALVVGILLLAIALSVTVWQLAALLLALSGPAIALLLLRRQPIGHIGVMQDSLFVVDHRGMYHFAGGSGVQYHGPFLVIDDIVVFSGSHLLPAFAPLQLHQLVKPLALGGVKVDRNTIVVKLLQSRHPFAQGAGVILAAITAAAMLLCIQGIF